MRLIMIGTPTCVKCKSMKPNISEYCNRVGIPFKYFDFSPVLPEDIKSLIIEKGIRTVPVFLLYRDNDTTPAIITGDDIYLELDM